MILSSVKLESAYLAKGCRQIRSNVCKVPRCSLAHDRHSVESSFFSLGIYFDWHKHLVTLSLQKNNQSSGLQLDCHYLPQAMWPGYISNTFMNNVPRATASRLPGRLGFLQRSRLMRAKESRPPSLLLEY